VSVVGRFLEHSRVYGFHRGDERFYWMGSGDLMPRNLDTRVELLVPIEDEKGRREIEETIELCLADDTFAWELRADDSWERRKGGTRSVHRDLMERAAEPASAE
jgi:polyphosphate kinase